MPIELDNFRKQYPQYDDMGDVELAEALYHKHPQYSDVLQKTYVEDEQRKAHKEPSTLYRELASPLLSAASTATTGGLFKEGLGALSPEAKASMFPEQKTIPGKILRGTAELGATLLGAPARIVGAGVNAASKLAPKVIIPLSKVAGASLGQKMATGALSGAIGGASLAAENLSPERQAGQIASGAVMGAAIPPVAQEVGKYFSPVAEKTSKLISQAGKKYRNVLNPGKGLIHDVEVKSKKNMDDFMNLAAEEGLVIQSKEGKIDTEMARHQITNIASDLESQLDDMLATDKSKKFDLVDIANKAKQAVRRNFKDPTEMKNAISDVDGQISDAIGIYGRYIDGSTANRIKQGKWSVSYDQLKPNTKKVSRTIGWAIKGTIEDGYPDEGIKVVNDKLGKYLTLDKILAKSHGNVVQQGKIGKYVSQGTGAIVGGAVGQSILPGWGAAVGSAGGATVGRGVSKFMSSPERITSGLRTVPSSASKLGSRIGDVFRGSKPIPVSAEIVSGGVSRNIPVSGQKALSVNKYIPISEQLTIEGRPNLKGLTFKERPLAGKAPRGGKIQGEGFEFRPQRGAPETQRLYSSEAERHYGRTGKAQRPTEGILGNKKGSVLSSGRSALHEEALKFNDPREFINSNIKKDYRGYHQLDSDSININQLNPDTLDTFINDFKRKYGYPALKSREVNKLKDIISDPEKDIKIYRASPKNELNNGDWITVDRDYAYDIRNQNGGNVHVHTVKAKDLYYPNSLKGFNELPELNRWGVFQYRSSKDIQNLNKIWNEAHNKTSMSKAISDTAKSHLGMMAGISTGAGIGATAFQGKAEAGQDINMERIYQIESSNKPNAYNKRSGAIGLGQITPIVLKEWNNFHANKKHTSEELRNADTNKKISSWYMNKRIPQMLKHYGHQDTVENRLIAYNWGIGNVGKKDLPKETSDYIKKYKR